MRMKSLSSNLREKPGSIVADRLWVGRCAITFSSASVAGIDCVMKACIRFSDWLAYDSIGGAQGARTQIGQCARSGSNILGNVSMSDITSKPRTKVRVKTERPKLHKVILVNDDYTPREFVVSVLKAEFRMNEEQAYRVMITAHQRGVCVVAVYAKDVAETKATRATDAGRAKGYPLMFTTEPEE